MSLNPPNVIKNVKQIPSERAAKLQRIVRSEDRAKY